jgi:hypothetical protein
VLIVAFFRTGILPGLHAALQRRRRRREEAK